MGKFGKSSVWMAAVFAFLSGLLLLPTPSLGAIQLEG